MSDRHTLTDSPIREVDIVIAGAGIVGCTAAALLSRLPPRNGKPPTILLLDRNPPPTKPGAGFDPRVVSLSLASEKLLRSTGVWPYIQKQRHCAYTGMDVLDHEGTGNIHFDAEPLELAGANVCHMGTIVENSVLVRGLLAFLEACTKVTLLHETDLLGLDTGTQASEIKLKDRRKGDIKTLKAGLIIAADGANSWVRQQAGIAIKQKPYDQKAIVATVKTEFPHRQRAWQSFLTSGPLAFLPLAEQTEGDTGHFSSIVWSLDDEEADTQMAAAPEIFEEQLSRLVRDVYGQVQLSGNRYCFSLIERHAHQYFARNVALVGDAAHTIHPLAGQGVNLGLADAGCLASEIVRAMDSGLSLAHPSVLRRYQRQRKHKNLEMMLLMQGFKGLFGHSAPTTRLIRNTGLKLASNSTWLKQWFTQQASGI